MNGKDVDRQFLEDCLKAIGEGLKEGVRREVERLTQLALPIYLPTTGRSLNYKPSRDQKARFVSQE